MPIGFAIFITAVIVSVVVILIYHFVIIGTSQGNNSGGGGVGGYNYDLNIQYLNTLTNSLAVPMYGPLNTQLGFNDGQTYPDLPSGADRFAPDLS